MNDFELIPITPIITSVTFSFTFHMHCITTLRNKHYRNLSNPLLIIFLSNEIATSFTILSFNETAAYSHEPPPYLQTVPAKGKCSGQFKVKLYQHTY